MIWYDSHKVSTLAKLRGSVLPKSFLWAIPSAIIAFALRYSEERGLLSLEALTVLSQGDIYSGFTFVLGFSLVFRTSQCYLRYWTAATSVHEMSCQWSDSCAGLIAFATNSPAPVSDITVFRHTVVRLFSLLHAVALAEIANIYQDLPLLDIDGLSKDQLVILTQGHAQGKKVQIVLSWIKAYIIRMGDVGLLNVPAPILTRVFQELGNGLVNYHKALQIVIWPFPFPYTQMNFLLLNVYVLITPVVVSTWETWAWVCCLFTFVSVTCMVGLDLIACELENPFGDDPNDLPVVDMQRDMNKFLTMQLNPMVHAPPALLETEAILEYKKLVLQVSTHLRMSDMNIKESTSVLGAQLSVTAQARATGNRRMQNAKLWRGELVEDETEGLAEWLHCEGHSGVFESTNPSDEDEEHAAEKEDGLGEVAGGSFSSGASPRDACRMTHESSRLSSPPPTLQTPATPHRNRTSRNFFNENGQPRRPRTSATFTYFSEDWERSPNDFQRDMGDFMRGLDSRMRDLFDMQLEVQKRELSAIEGLLSRPRLARRRSADEVSGGGGEEKASNASTSFQAKERSKSPSDWPQDFGGRRRRDPVSDSESDKEYVCLPPRLPEPTLMLLSNPREGETDTPVAVRGTRWWDKSRCRDAPNSQ